MEKMNDTIRQLRIKLGTHLIIQNRSQGYADGYNIACGLFESMLNVIKKIYSKRKTTKTKNNYTEIKAYINQLRQQRQKLTQQKYGKKQLKQAKEFTDGLSDAFKFFDELVDEIEQNKKPIPKNIVKAKLILEKKGR